MNSVLLVSGIKTCPRKREKRKEEELHLREDVNTKMGTWLLFSNYVPFSTFYKLTLYNFKTFFAIEERFGTSKFSLLYIQLWIFSFHRDIYICIHFVKVWVYVWVFICFYQEMPNIMKNVIVSNWNVSHHTEKVKRCKSSSVKGAMLFGREERWLFDSNEKCFGSRGDNWNRPMQRRESLGRKRKKRESF